MPRAQDAEQAESALIDCIYDTTLDPSLWRDAMRDLAAIMGGSRPLFVNGTAERILGKGDGLRLDRQGLHAAHPWDGHRLREALGAALGGVGCAAQEVARQHRVAVSTVRTQIERILAKTETERQTDLVALLHRAATLPES